MPGGPPALDAGDVAPGLGLEEIATMLANTRLLVMHDWVQGRIGDDELGFVAKRTFLLFARSIACGPTQARVDQELRKLLKSVSG